MTSAVVIERNKAGLQDLLFGTGTQQQTRAGEEVVITEINAQNLPFDETRNLKEALLDEKGIAFATFSVNDDGELIANYTDLDNANRFSIDNNGNFVVTT